MVDLTSLWNQVEKDRLERKHGHIGNVVYTLTSNYDWYLLPSLVSLLRNDEVDKVYIITNSDTWGYTLPDNVVICDCSNQKFFAEDSINYDYWASSVSLLRVAISQIIEEDKCLNMDCDTIINHSLQNLYDLDLGSNYFAMVREYNTTRFITYNKINYNAGVMLMNLKLLRESGADFSLINLINNTKLDCVEQDAINILYQDRIIEIITEYNLNQFTVAPNKLYVDPIVVHFCGASMSGHSWQYDDSIFWNKIYLDYYKMYIETYTGLKLKDLIPEGV